MIRMKCAKYIDNVQIIKARLDNFKCSEENQYIYTFFFSYNLHRNDLLQKHLFYYPMSYIQSEICKLVRGLKTMS